MNTDISDALVTPRPRWSAPGDHAGGRPAVFVSTASVPGPRGRRVTVVVPAYNEAACLADTIRSIQAQTRPADEIIVVDDCSSDGTGDIARSLGVRVVRTARTSGCKASALNAALPHVTGDFVLTIDADTVLATDAIELLMPAMDDPLVAGASGFVVPRRITTLWERGRYVEYLLAFGLFRPIQNYYDRPVLASGCFSAYRTTVLRDVGGWPARTVAEDMDLTWNLYLAGYAVRFVPEALCYPIEPRDLRLLSRQLRRWSCGLVQAVRVHWRAVLHVPYLRMIVAIGLWDSTITALAMLLLLPALAIVVSPQFLLGYLIDIPAVTVPVLHKARQRREVLRALSCLPSYFILRFVNAWFFLAALWGELVARRRLATFEKGH